MAYLTAFVSVLLSALVTTWATHGTMSTSGIVWFVIFAVSLVPLGAVLYAWLTDEG